MEYFKLIQKRQSIRSFKEEKIQKDNIKKIIEAAIRAPSAGDLQAYEIYAVVDEDKKNELSVAALGQDSVKEASFCLVFCAHPKLSSIKYGDRGKNLYCIQDATIACTYAQLAAYDLGYGSVWVGAFDDNKVRDVIGADESLIPVAILPVGLPNEKPDFSPRRDFNDIVNNF